MLVLFQNRSYTALFAAQVVALLGTGLLSVALGLLAFDLAGDKAGIVLGTAFTLKMVAYVGLSPIAQAFAVRLPRKAVLVGADMVRAAVALCLPFVSEVWQVYALIFVLQAASATFTPAYQALLPDVLPDEGDYTRALSLSRLAYELENLASPALAGLVLTFSTYSALFLGTLGGFCASALLIARVALPAIKPGASGRPFRERLTRGARIYLATPRLRGLLALNLAVASAGAFVLVNTVVMVRVAYGYGEVDLAVALGAFGAGAMVAALLLPRLLELLPERGILLVGGAVLASLALGGGVAMMLDGLPRWEVFLGLWASLGAGFSMVATPSGRLLRRSAHSEDIPAVFAAQFALSHACWLVTYPLAAFAGDRLGLFPTLVLMGAVALGAVLAARALWPREAQVVEHDHPDLPPDHPHLKAHHGQRRHAHVFVIDDEHRAWPTQG